MKINDITANDIRTIDEIIGLAKSDIVVMNLKQWQTSTAGINHEKIDQLFARITYFGFFKPEDKKSNFYLCFYTGDKVPRDITKNWTQITDVRIATPQEEDSPLIIFGSSGKLSKKEMTFIDKNFFGAIKQAYTAKPVATYGFSNISFANAQNPAQSWNWSFGNKTDEIPSDLIQDSKVLSLFPLPGMDDTIAILDTSDHVSYYGFKSGTGFIQIDRTAI